MPALHTLLWPLSLGRTEYITEGVSPQKKMGALAKGEQQVLRSPKTNTICFRARKQSQNSGGARSQGNTCKSHVGVPFPLSRRDQQGKPPQPPAYPHSATTSMPQGHQFPAGVSPIIDPLLGINYFQRLHLRGELGNVT